MPQTHKTTNVLWACLPPYSVRDFWVPALLPAGTPYPLWEGSHPSRHLLNPTVQKSRITEPFWCRAHLFPPLNLLLHVKVLLMTEDKMIYTTTPAGATEASSMGAATVGSFLLASLCSRTQPQLCCSFSLASPPLICHFQMVNNTCPVVHVFRSPHSTLHRKYLQQIWVFRFSK